MDWFKTITTATKSSVTAWFDRMRRQLSFFYRIPMILAQKSRAAVKKVFDFALGKPASEKDYVKAGNTLFSKSMLVKLLIAVAALVFVMVRFVYPYLDGWLWTASVVVNSEKFHSFSGKANVKMADGSVIYRGTMADGSITGTGELYDRDGQLLYRGEIEKEKYNGTGSAYENGELLYTGSFSDNLYEGSGTLYYPGGGKRYVGNFSGGQFEGEGTLYYPDGREEYMGLFARGRYEGQGCEYYPNGAIKYEGRFEDGLYQGAGRQFYEVGTVWYEGYFERGERTGAGRLYRTDGSLLYDGNFLRDMYDGHGRLMGEKGRLLYEGSFAEGVYDGEGRLMNPDGSLLYEGGFALGLYEGFGKLHYDNRTLYEGFFYQGVYHGHGQLYGQAGTLIFEGNFIMGEIDYLAYIDCTRTEIETIFGKSRRWVYDDSFFYLQPELDVGFLFYFGDGLSEPKVHRIIFFGTQKLMQVARSQPLSAFEQSYPDTYTAYWLTVEDLEFTALDYLGLDYRPGDEIYCAKTITGDLFIRAFAQRPEGEVLYYEIGGVQS